MQRKVWFVLFAVFILTFCSEKQTVKGEVILPPKVDEDKIEKIEKTLAVTNEYVTPLYYNYKIYRLNQLKYNARPYTITNTNFFTALNQEFDHSLNSKSEALASAIKGYHSLTTEMTNEKGFLYQRIGVCYYKMRKYPQSYIFINGAIATGTRNPELFYYKSLLHAYYKHEPEKALIYAQELDPDKAFLPKQDYYYYLAGLQRELGKTKDATKSYREAMTVSPVNFYLKYDLLPYFLAQGEISEAKEYTANSFTYLQALKLPKYRIKAYSQVVRLNQYLNKETFRYTFPMTSAYNYYPNIPFFSSSPVFTQRILSGYLEFPLTEKKSTRQDKVFYTLYEDFCDYGQKTGFYVAAANVTMTNFQYQRGRMFTPVQRLSYTSNAMVLLSPTNIYVIITNLARNTNHPEYIVTNQSNAIYIGYPQMKHYLDSGKFDVNGDNDMDFLMIGFDNTNTAALAIFNPDKLSLANYHFPVKNYNAEIVIQDVDNDGKNDILLFDDDVYFLKPDSLTNTNR